MQKFEEDSNAHGKQYDIKSTIQNRLMGFGSHGSSVMIGKDARLIKLLEEWAGRTNIVSTHCVAHSLELAAEAAWTGKGNEVMGYSDLQQFMIQIYYYYSKGQRATRATELAEFMDKDMHPLTALKGTC